MSDIVNSVGLALDIVGVVLLFKFGLPPEVNRGGSIILSWDKDPDEAKKAKTYERTSYVALACLVMGFTLQIVSNYI